MSCEGISIKSGNILFCEMFYENIYLEKKQWKIYDTVQTINQYHILRLPLYLIDGTNQNELRYSRQ